MFLRLDVSPVTLPVEPSGIYWQTQRNTSGGPLFRIEMLPASEGDALWIEYGHPHSPRRILIDGGPARTYPALRSRILQLPREARRLDLVVVTHIDADHIDGVIRLLLDESLGVEYGDIWFNGYPQLVPPDTLGVSEGEILGAILTEKGLPWNRAFGGKAAVVGAEPDPSFLPDGLGCRIVGPTWRELDILLADWDRTLATEGWITGDLNRAREELTRRARLKPPDPIEEEPLPDELGDEVFIGDTSKANGASIAMIFEDEDGHSGLFAGDAHGPVLEAELNRVGGGARIAVDTFKLPHHGSRKNVSAGLLDAVDPKRYLVSSSGSKYRHPDEASVERILTRHTGESRKPIIDFNYRSPYNEMWADPELQEYRGYVANYPRGLAIEL